MTALNIPAQTMPPRPGATMADATRKQGGAEFGRLMATANSRAQQDKPAPAQPCGEEDCAQQIPIRSDSGQEELRPEVDHPPHPREADAGPAVHNIRTDDEACKVLRADLLSPEWSEAESDYSDEPVAHGAVLPQQMLTDPVPDGEQADPVAPAPDDGPELAPNGPATMHRADALELVRNGSKPDARSPEQPNPQPTGEFMQQRNLQRNTSVAWPEADMPASTATPDSKTFPDPLIGFAATAPPPRDLAATHDLLAATRAAASPEPHRQIADAIVRTRSGQVEIMLDPVELGRVTVLLGEDGNPGRIAVFVERPETLELIRRHSDQLLRDLRENGMPDAQLGDLRQDGSGNRRESALPPAARDRPAAQDQHAPERATRPPARAVTLTRLDIRF